jgi:RHS repeat-associated protein
MRTWTHGARTVVQGFLYDDALRIAAELDASGNVVSTFAYGTRVNWPDSMVRSGKTYRFLTDWRGSVRAVVDSGTGTVVESIDYDAWGNATVSDSTCAAGAVCASFQPFGFAGGLVDRETALVRFGERDYSASVGRWTQKDPVRFDGRQANFYVYVGDDPINRVDPTGRFDWFTCVELEEATLLSCSAFEIDAPVCAALAAAYFQWCLWAPTTPPGQCN